jgi:hypothetical protein
VSEPRTLPQLRAIADSTEERAFMALRDYLHDRRSYDNLEKDIASAFCAQRELAAAESLEHVRQVCGRETVASLARMCGVHLGPDLGPDPLARREAAGESDLPKNACLDLNNAFLEVQR